MFNVFTKKIETFTWSELGDLVKEQIYENQYIDYKREFIKNIELAKKIASFANTKGGWIFIGIDEDNCCPIDVCGYKPGEGNNPEKDPISKVANIVSGNIFPTPYIDTKEILLGNGNRVLVIRVYEGFNTPYIVEGTVYHRVHDSSKVVKDAYDLHKILDKRKAFTNKIERFSSNPMSSYYNYAFGSSDVLAELYFYTDPDNFEIKNFFTVNFKDRLKKSLNSSSWWMFDKISGHMKFNTIESSFESYILRSIENLSMGENNLKHPGTVFEIFPNGWARFFIKLPKYDCEKFLKHRISEFQFGKDLARMLQKYNINDLPNGIIDAYDSFTIVAVLTSHYQKILRESKFTGRINFRLRLKNADGNIIFADDNEYIKFAEQNSIVVNFKENIEMPPFTEGKVAQTELDKEKEDINGVQTGLYFLQALGVNPLIYRENILDGIESYLRFKYKPNN